jgi:hypothetical protein
MNQVTIRLMFKICLIKLRKNIKAKFLLCRKEIVKNRVN